MEYNPQTPELDLSQETIHLEVASVGQRFVNYLIDTIGFYFLTFCYGFLMALVNPATVQAWSEEPEGFDVNSFFISIAFFILYMSLMEFALKGRSLGKLVSGTKAVNEDGTEITAKTAFLRTLSRFVPFEVFSVFGGGQMWHDNWTNTYVIDIKKSTIPPQI